MTIQREGHWLTATRSPHVAYEIEPQHFRLSLLPERLVTAAQAVAGLTISEIVEEWSQLLWETDNESIRMVWALLADQARTLGLDALDAVIRVQQSQWPASAAEWAEWWR